MLYWCNVSPHWSNNSLSEVLFLFQALVYKGRQASSYLGFSSNLPLTVPSKKLIISCTSSVGLSVVMACVQSHILKSWDLPLSKCLLFLMISSAPSDPKKSLSPNTIPMGKSILGLLRRSVDCNECRAMKGNLNGMSCKISRTLWR